MKISIADITENKIFIEGATALVHWGELRKTQRAALFLVLDRGNFMVGLIKKV